MPGLVVCHAPERQDGRWVEARRTWQVIHVLSGWKIGQDFTTMRAAMAIVGKIGPLADWMRPADELAGNKQLRQEMLEVMGR